MTVIDAFVTDVGLTGPISVAGSRSHWAIGGSLVEGTRVISAPTGLVELEPADMTVRVNAGTRLDDLDVALAEHGQRTRLPVTPEGTVGGALMVGHSDVHRLGRGPLRDALLEAKYVSAQGLLIKAGGPTVKNVSGFDLCRLLVGSLGTLGLLGEVVLRTEPRGETSRWLNGPADPLAVYAGLYEPTSILWDGATVWAHLEGNSGDVEAQSAVAAGLGLSSEGGPPPLPAGRISLPPERLADLTGEFVAEIGVGVVHTDRLLPREAVPPEVLALGRTLKNRYDPDGRLNPGRDVYTQ